MPTPSCAPGRSRSESPVARTCGSNNSEPPLGDCKRHKGSNQPREPLTLQEALEISNALDTHHSIRNYAKAISPEDWRATETRLLRRLADAGISTRKVIFTFLIDAQGQPLGAQSSIKQASKRGRWRGGTADAQT